MSKIWRGARSIKRGSVGSMLAGTLHSVCTSQALLIKLYFKKNKNQKSVKTVAYIFTFRRLWMSLPSFVFIIYLKTIFFFKLWGKNLPGTFSSIFFCSQALFKINGLGRGVHKTSKDMHKTWKNMHKNWKNLHKISHFFISGR